MSLNLLGGLKEGPSDPEDLTNFTVAVDNVMQKSLAIVNVQ